VLAAKLPARQESLDGLDNPARPALPDLQGNQDYPGNRARQAAPESPANPDSQYPPLRFQQGRLMLP